MEIKLCTKRHLGLERWQKERLGDMDVAALRQKSTSDFATTLASRIDRSSSAVQTLRAVSTGRSKGNQIDCFFFDINLKT